MLGGVVKLSVSIDAVISTTYVHWRQQDLVSRRQTRPDTSRAHFRRSFKEFETASLSDAEIIERLIESLLTERPHLVPPKPSGEHFSSGEEAYNFIYLATAYNLRKDLERR